MLQLAAKDIDLPLVPVPCSRRRRRWWRRRQLVLLMILLPLMRHAHAVPLLFVVVVIQLLVQFQHAFRAPFVKRGDNRMHDIARRRGDGR